MKLRVVWADKSKTRKVVRVTDYRLVQKLPPKVVARGLDAGYLSFEPQSIPDVKDLKQAGDLLIFHTEDGQPDVTYRIAERPGRYWSEDVDVPPNEVGVASGSHSAGERVIIADVPETFALRRMTEVRNYYLCELVEEAA